MLCCIKYAWLTVKHKYFVFRVGFRLKVPILRLLLHDISKFSFKELPHYGKQFFGSGNDPLGFAKAWIHHQNHNEHHWEYWIPRTGHDRSSSEYKTRNPIEMPENAVREMVSDWLGASRAYEGSLPKTREGWWWLQNKYENIIVHDRTKLLIEGILEEWFNSNGDK